MTTEILTPETAAPIDLTGTPSPALAIRVICNLWVDPDTRYYSVDRCEHPLEELIAVVPAKAAQQAVTDAFQLGLAKGLEAQSKHIVAKEPMRYQKPRLDSLQHLDNCRHWDDSETCSCGADAFHELDFWKQAALSLSN